MSALPLGPFRCPVCWWRGPWGRGCWAVPVGVTVAGWVWPASVPARCLSTLPFGGRGHTVQEAACLWSVHHPGVALPFGSSSGSVVPLLLLLGCLFVCSALAVRRWWGSEGAH